MHEYLEFIKILEAIKTDIDNGKPLKALIVITDAIAKYDKVIELFEEAESEIL